MKINLKTLLKLGAAVLVGAAVFVGSTVLDKKPTTSTSSNNTATGCQQQQSQSGTQNVGSEGLRDIQTVMMKTSQFITTMITVSDAIGRLFSIEPVPRYSSSTIII